MFPRFIRSERERERDPRNPVGISFSRPDDPRVVTELHQVFGRQAKRLVGAKEILRERDPRSWIMPRANTPCHGRLFVIVRSVL